MKISLDGKELISLDPPENSKRKDEPLHLPPKPMQAGAPAKNRALLVTKLTGL